MNVDLNKQFPKFNPRSAGNDCQGVSDIFQNVEGNYTKSSK